MHRLNRQIPGRSCWSSRYQNHFTMEQTIWYSSHQRNSLRSM